MRSGGKHGKMGGKHEKWQSKKNEKMKNISLKIIDRHFRDALKCVKRPLALNKGTILEVWIKTKVRGKHEHSKLVH